MKEGIHPTYYPEARVICVCGNTWKVGSTQEEIRLDICSNCHPFYTGEQRIVDTEGQVDRFYKRLEARQAFIDEVTEREAERTSPDRPIADLELGKRTDTALEKAEITNVGQILDKFAAGGDKAMLALDGIGRKSLADIKKKLRALEYELPHEIEEEEAA